MLLKLCAIFEAATGLAVLIIPSLGSWLLFGAELAGVSVLLARVTGIALIGLVVSCWAGSTALCGMFTYCALVTLYLAYLGIAREFSGILLWPAMLLHAVLTVLLTKSWFKERGRTVTRP